MLNARLWPRMVAVLIVTFAASLNLVAPASAASRSWSDNRCDVRGYDWYADDHYRGKCAGIDIYSVEVSNSRNAVSVAAKFDMDWPWYLKKDEKQRVWFNTDRDRRPEYLVTAYRPNYRGTVGRLARVNGWRGNGRAVRCGGDSIRIAPAAEKLLVDIPRSCLSKFRRVRVSVRSFDRTDGGKSWRKDSFPGARSWSPRVTKS